MTKLEYYTAFHKFQLARERYFTPLFKKVLRQQQQQWIDAVNAGLSYDNALQAITYTPMLILDKQLYEDAARIWGNKVRLYLNTANKATGRISFTEEMIRLVNNYFQIDLLNTVNEITDTTKNNIIEILQQATVFGWSFDEIVNRITNDELNIIRARRIARTETVTAANQAAIFSGKASGLKLKKEWLATFDNRTRHDHRNVNGTVVNMDEPFIVGGAAMMQPGDRNNGQTPAKEIVNCRCTVLLIPQK